MTTVLLPARCTQAAAEEMLPELRQALESGALEIDGRQVEQVGQAMLQVLLSARCTSEAVVIRPSEALVRTAGLTGLSDTLFGATRP